MKCRLSAELATQGLPEVEVSKDSKSLYVKGLRIDSIKILTTYLERKRMTMC
jgi:hypothetical protein